MRLFANILEKEDGKMFRNFEEGVSVVFCAIQDLIFSFAKFLLKMVGLRFTNIDKSERPFIV